MAGLAAGWGRWGQPLADVYKPAPQEQQNQQAAGGAPGVDTAPSKPKMQFAYNTGDRNAPRPNFRYQGMMANQGILPSPMDPFRRYGTVQGGKVIPPQNPFAEPPGIRYTPGGEWGGGGPGPINTAPSFPNAGGAQLPPMYSNTPGGYSLTGEYRDPTQGRGGFTGGQMPPPMGPEAFNPLPSTPPNRFLQSETSGARTGYYNPQTQIPNMNMGGTGNIGQRGDQRFQNRSMLRNAYAGAGPSLSSRPFRSQMYY